MADDSEQNEIPAGEELAQTRIAELERLAAEKDKELSLANARIAELEQTVASLESEVGALKQSNLESDQKLAEVSNALSQAISSYKARVTESHPEIPVDLMTGDTIETIDNSLENTKALIGRVRQGLETEMAATKVPAGAPQRTPTDLSVLSPREKIQYAIGGKR